MILIFYLLMKRLNLLPSLKCNRLFFRYSMRNPIRKYHILWLPSISKKGEYLANSYTFPSRMISEGNVLPALVSV